MLLQPCDWVEHDVQGKYVIDVFGRTDKQKVACLRITGFKPYFYVSSKQIPSTAQVYEQANRQWEIKFGPRKGQRDYAYKLSKKIFEYLVPELTKVQKYDVMQGFQELNLIDVWKVTCGSQAIFQAAKSIWRSLPQYESNLHPFLRLFHDRHLGPASPIRIENAEFTDIPLDEQDEPLYRVDEFYTCDYMDVYPAEAQIPLLVASYDLEMYSESGLFPQATKDPIIQIGVSYRWTHKMLEPALRVVYVLGDVAPSEDDSVEFVSCASEHELLTEFMQDIRERNPDIMCGYNIFNFDDGYIEGRCQKLGITFDVSRKQAEFGEKAFETKKSELASGKYDLRFMSLRGRLNLDLLITMRREHNLASYKLDDVASVFLRGKVVGYKGNQIKTKSTRGLYNGNYVRFETVGNTLDSLYEGRKFEVYDVQKDSFRVKTDDPLFEGEDINYIEWTFSKDDVDHILLFQLHKQGGPEGRAKIAKYCIQDCDLVLNLMAKLDTIVNARGMSDVCKVPMDYVLQRGQGIKIFSAVLYYASQRNQIISVQDSLDEDTGYEGAIVLPPKIGMYLEQPISVLDFNSLYPTNMIAYNLSPDTLVSVRVFNEHGQKISEEGYMKKEFERLEQAGYVLDEIEYDDKETGGKTICTYVQKDSNNPMTEGVLPKTLDILLKKRKEFKEKMEDLQYDEAQRSVFNGLQLAYKVVANSVYGQTGSRTSPIRKLCVAACTTAAGRKALNLAKHIAETEYNAEVIYGDTDSIFIKFPTQDLSESIRLGIDAGKKITSACRRPYKIAYEKTFYPFILFRRKRYIGMMYEEDPKVKPKRKEMGIPLKRRDNAPIVKDVYGGALDIILKERNIKKAQQFVNQKLVDILENRIPLEKFIVSKSLRDDYAAMKEDYDGPATVPAHRVLADRMTKRDPGNAPKVGERLQFIYVAENSKAEKQGDRIEDIAYVRKKDLHPDFVFYITNQVQNPVAQLFALCIEQLEGYVPPRKPSYGSLMEVMMEKYKQDEEEATKAVLDKKADQLDSIMFLGSRPLANILRKNTRGPMDSFLGRK